MIPLLLLPIYFYSSQGSNSRYTYSHFLLIILIVSIAYFTLIASVSLITSVTLIASVSLIVSIILIASIILIILLSHTLFKESTRNKQCRERCLARHYIPRRRSV